MDFEINEKFISEIAIIFVGSVIGASVIAGSLYQPEQPLAFIYCGDDICVNSTGHNEIIRCPSDCPYFNNTELISQLRSYQRPLAGGIEINNSNGTNNKTCTLGAIFEKNGSRYILTAEHCISENHTVVSQGGEVVGTLYNSSYETDSALILLYSNITSKLQDYLGDNVTCLGAKSAMRREMEVYKVGRTTGLTYGKITDFGSDEFTVTGDSGIFCNPGDSGSAIMSASINHIVYGILSSADINWTTCRAHYGEDIAEWTGLPLCL